MRLIATLALALAMALATPAFAVVIVDGGGGDGGGGGGPTGSGRVKLEMLSFSGPIALGPGSDFSPSNWYYGSTINGTNVVGSDVTGATARDPASPMDLNWYTGSVQLNNASSVRFGYSIFPSDSAFFNVISLTPSAFSNVAVGQEFKLGSISFQNGLWFGAGPTAAGNVETNILFRVTTESTDGAQFNQTNLGRIQLTVHQPDNNNNETLAGQDAQADWITVFNFDQTNSVWQEIESFRVYDDCCKPAGFTNIGSVDLNGKFGSISLTSLTNPTGGFLTDGSGALPSDPLPPPPPPPPAIPEPASWAMLIAGFGLTGAMLRRRRALATG